MSLLLILATTTGPAPCASVVNPIQRRDSGRSIVLTPMPIATGGGGPVVFRSSSNTGNSVGSATSRAPAVPTGATTDDIVLVFLDIWDGSADPTVTPPAGFTQKYKVSAGTGVKAYCFWKRLTGADAGTYSFTWGATGMFATADAMCFSGCVTTGDPIGANFNTTTANSTTFPNTTVSPAYIPGLAWHGYNDSAGTHTPPTGYTEQIDVDCATDAYFIPVASGPYTATAGTVSVSSDIVSALVALQPAGAGGPAIGPTAPIVSSTSRMPTIGRVLLSQQGTDTSTVTVTNPAPAIVSVDTGRARLPSGRSFTPSTPVEDVAPKPPIVVEPVVQHISGRSIIVAPIGDPPVTSLDTPVIPIVKAFPRIPAPGFSALAGNLTDSTPVEDVAPKPPIVVEQIARYISGRSIIVAPIGDPPVASPDTPVIPIVKAFPRIPTSGFSALVGNLTDTPIAVGETPTPSIIKTPSRLRVAGVSIVVAPQPDVAIVSQDSSTGTLVITGRSAPVGKVGRSFTVSGFADVVNVSAITPVVVTPLSRRELGKSLLLGGSFGNPPPPQITPVSPIVTVATRPVPQGKIFLAQNTRILSLLVASQSGVAYPGNVTSVTSQSGTETSVTSVAGSKPTSVTAISGSSSSVTSSPGVKGTSVTAVGGG